jgi:threonine aldolase
VKLARKHGLSAHLDGARIFNASVKLGISVAELCHGFDTVSVCLSKGLGTPAGTVLVGRRDVIARARRIRKMLGGTMRQVGVLAAAGLYALDNNVDRLAVDHANAQRLGQGLAALGLKVEPVQTNMVFVTIPAAGVEGFAKHVEAQGIKMLVHGPRLRLVTHLDLDAAAVDRVIEAFESFFAASTSAPARVRSVS